MMAVRLKTNLDIVNDCDRFVLSPFLNLCMGSDNRKGSLTTKITLLVTRVQYPHCTFFTMQEMKLSILLATCWTG